MNTHTTIKNVSLNVDWKTVIAGFEGPSHSVLNMSESLFWSYKFKYDRLLRQRDRQVCMVTWMKDLHRLEETLSKLRVFKADVMDSILKKRSVYTIDIDQKVFFDTCIQEVN